MIVVMRNAAVLLLAFALVSCSSSSTPKANIIQPEVDLQQVIGPAELNYPSGYADLKFEVDIENRSGEPITLRRVELATIGTGAYLLRRDFHVYNETIAPHRTGAITVWAKAQIYGGTTSEQEPVRVRGVLHCESFVSIRAQTRRSSAAVCAATSRNRRSNRRRPTRCGHQPETRCTAGGRRLPGALRTSHVIR